MYSPGLPTGTEATLYSTEPPAVDRYRFTATTFVAVGIGKFVRSNPELSGTVTTTGGLLPDSSPEELMNVQVSR
jgi:hypothetical protein